VGYLSRIKFLSTVIFNTGDRKTITSSYHTVLIDILENKIFSKCFTDKDRHIIKHGIYCSIFYF